MKKILMVPPDKFAVEYQINPWMNGNIDTVDKVKAAQQWLATRDALIQAGADVIVLPSPPVGCPDAVFAANAGLIFKDMYINSKFKHEERQGEEDYFEEYFDAHDYDMLEFPDPNRTLSFEGAGDALFSADRKHLWFGYGWRSSGDYKFKLDEMFENTDVIVRPLKLVDPRWYHLDTAFCPLDTGELLWYPPAFDAHSQMVIESWYEGKDIKVSEEDALRFACNAVSVGKNIVIPHCSDDLFFNLMDRGYGVLTVDMSQFLRSGGACKCLTLEVVE